MKNNIWWIKSCLTYEDIFNEEAKKDDLLNLIRTFNRTDCLILLSKILIFLAYQQQDNPNIQNSLVPGFFDQDTLQKIIKFQEATGAKIIFWDRQLLYISTLVLTNCSEETRQDFKSPEDRQRFGVCCLMAGSLCLAEFQNHEKDADLNEQKRRLTQLCIKQHAFHSSDQIRYLIPRYYDLFYTIPGEMKISMNFPGIFEEVAGLDLDTHFALGIGLYSRWANIKVSDILQPGRFDIFLDPDTWFSQTTVPQIQVNKIFDNFTIDIDELVNMLHCNYPAEGDSCFVELKEHPLVKLGHKRIICPNPKFLYEKITEGIYWSILNGIRQKKRRSEFLTSFGKVFEEYVRRILRRAFPQRVHFKRYGKHLGEASDAIVEYPDCLVFFEAKSGRLRLKTLMTGTIETFIKEMWDKSVLRAAKQLNDRISDFQKGKYSICGRKAKDFKRFYPVVVTLQTVPQDPLIWEVLDRELKNEGLLKDPGIRPLQFMDIEELEMLEALLDRESFVDLLQEKIKDSKAKCICFKNFLFSKYGAIPPNQHLHHRFNQLSEKTKSILFGSQSIKFTQ